MKNEEFNLENQTNENFGASSLDEAIKDDTKKADCSFGATIVEVNNLSKYYVSPIDKIKRDYFKKEVKQVKALDDVSLEVKEGEIFGLLGANGSGKTTLIKLLCGLILKDKGEIKIFGNNIEKDRTYLKDVGAIVEAPTMFKNLTGRENLRYFASLSGKLPEQRIDDILNLVGLSDRADTKFATYSLGMQQRLGIAQAIMANPKLLILDEPINGLDPEGIAQMRALFQKLSKTYGTTIIISSHILSEMQELCDRVAILVSGKIVAIKDLNEIVSTTQKEIAKIMCDKPQEAFDIISTLEDVEVKLVNDAVYVRCINEKIALINKSLIKKDINVYSVTIKKRTLEDIYKELAK